MERAKAKANDKINFLTAEELLSCYPLYGRWVLNMVLNPAVRGRVYPWLRRSIRGFFCP